MTLLTKRIQPKIHQMLMGKSFCSRDAFRQSFTNVSPVPKILLDIYGYCVKQSGQETETWSNAKLLRSASQEGIRMSGLFQFGLSLSLTSCSYSCSMRPSTIVSNRKVVQPWRAIEGFRYLLEHALRWKTGGDVMMKTKRWVVLWQSKL